MPSQTLKKWFLIYTNARAEKKVSQWLSEKDIENFCPLQKTLKQWSDRKKWVEEPIIRSYIFVNIVQSQYYDVLNIKGVVRYIFFEGKPVEVPSRQIESFKKVIENKIEIETIDQKIAQGQKIELKQGNWAGFSGEVVEIRGHKKVILRIDGLSESFLLNIPMEEFKI